MQHRKITNPEAQEIYEILLKDDRFRCTCDEVVREESFFQVLGHYHHCMLYQVSRAIELSLMYRDGYRLVNGEMVHAQSTSEAKP